MVKTNLITKLKIFVVLTVILITIPNQVSLVDKSYVEILRIVRDAESIFNLFGPEASIKKVPKEFISSIREGYRELRREVRKFEERQKIGIRTTKKLIKEMVGIDIPEVSDTFSQQVQDELLRKLAEQKPEGSIIYLGVWNGFYLPLLESALKFEKVTLVDYDLETLKWVKNKVSKHLHRLGIRRKQRKEILARIKFHIADISGHNAKILAKAEDIIKSTHYAFAGKAFNELIDLLGKTEPVSWSIPQENKYDYVISNRLIHRIAVDLLDYIIEVFEDKFGPAITEHLFTADIIHSESITNFKKVIELDHIDLLSELSRGLVYLDGILTLTSMQFNILTGEWEFIDRHDILTPVEAIRRKIERNFLIEKDKQWNFEIQLDSSIKSIREIQTWFLSPF